MILWEGSLYAHFNEQPCDDLGGMILWEVRFEYVHFNEQAYIKGLFGLVVVMKKAIVSCEKSCGLWVVRKLKFVWLETAVKLYGAIKRSNFGIMSSPHSLKFDLVFIISFPDLW
jgi:hypothetical protein